MRIAELKNDSFKAFLFDSIPQKITSMSANLY